MNTKIRRIISTILIVIASFLFLNVSSVAALECGTAETSIIKCDQKNTGDNIENNGIWGVLSLATNILTAGIGIAAVGGIIYGSILYATSGVNPDNVKKAKGIIMNVVIGLIAWGLMYAFLNFIIPGGIIG